MKTQETTAPKETKQLESQGSSFLTPPAFSLSAGANGANANLAISEATVNAKPKLNVPGVPQELVKMLEEFEGIRWVVYLDTLGNPTGGMGHLITSDEMASYPVGTKIPQTQVEAWAQQDVGSAWEAAQSQSSELGVTDHNFKVAMASMCFQNGNFWYTVHKKTWALMKAHKWEEAALEAADSQWARETPTRVPGFQAALRSQINDGTKKTSTETAGDDPFTATKHGLPNKDKIEKIEQAIVTSGMLNSGEVPTGIEGMKTIQTKLRSLGLYEGKIDGIATSTKGESKTVVGIKRFQEMKGLPVTGEVDAATWSKLDEGKAGNGGSIWDRFMAKQKEKVRAESKKTNATGQSTGPANNFVDEKYFVSQSPDVWDSRRATEPGWTNCRQAATDIAIRYLQGEMPEMATELGIDGIEDLSRDAGYLCIQSEDKSHKSEVRGEKNESHPEWLVAHEQMDIAIAYINEKLSAKVPVVIGVDHTFNRDLGSKNKTASKSGMGYNEGTTDHFITLTGAGVDDKGRKYYSYFDVATSHVDRGTSSENKLVETAPGKFNRSSGAGSSGNQAYYLSMVLTYQHDRPKYEKEIQKNLADKKAIGL